MATGNRFPGTIVATTDAGATWTTQMTSPPPLFGLSCPTPTTCFAVGGAGTILATFDGGSTWIPQSSGTTSQLQAIACPSSTTCIAVGGAANAYLPATIVVTRDSGNTWTAQPLGGSVFNLNAITCTGVSTCFAVGDLGTILATTDAGATWLAQSPQPEADANLMGVSCQSTQCFVVGTAGTILARAGVPAQRGGADFGLTAGPLPAVGSALLSWSVGTQQTGYQLVRVAGDTGSLAVLPTPGSPLPAPAQSYADTGSLTESSYCYVLVPLDRTAALGQSNPLCLAPATHSAAGAPPTFTLSVNPRATATLTWTPPGGQDGYVLVAVAADGSARSQFLASTTTMVTDTTSGQPTCYIVLSSKAGAVFGNSDWLCDLPSPTVGVPRLPRTLPGLRGLAGLRS